MNFLLGRKSHSTSTKNGKFVDLAPTSDADKDGIYFEALDYATRNPNVFNIALTGPYGSGKSSVIKAFLTKYRKPYLNISLAAFLPEAGSHQESVEKQEIERSILQQILYGTGASKLPNSRFKRIRYPKAWSFFLPPFVIGGAYSLWHLFTNRADIKTGDFFVPFTSANWFNIISFAFGLIFLWVIIRQLYHASFGLSLKGVSLKNIEIKTDNESDESILNRHLDEIIYFFQSTKYELVIVEDLDRFQNPDIFVTLREINGLINANSGVNRQVRFLYALRDDIFINIDRTKFFEFIIPVVPIINHSNSIDKVLEQGERLNLVKDLDSEFLRKVSRHLSDLRLIRNVFNEYVLYSNNLKTVSSEGLDPNKLLAILIYKNVLPKDFEALHQQKGILSGLFDLSDRFIEEHVAKNKAQIANIEAEIEDARQQIPRDLDELRKIYAMTLIEKLPPGHRFIGFNNRSIPIETLASNPDFKHIIVQTRIQSKIQEHNSWHTVPIGKIEQLVAPGMTFAERVEICERQSAKFIEVTEQRIGYLRSDIDSVRVKKFHELVRLNTELAAKSFCAFGENEDLMRFLVYEGYIDNTYYQYISLFHSGRLSPNDNRFLIKIGSSSNPHPGFQIDNPSEVVAEMSEEDFGQQYVLNRHLIDYFFTQPSEHEVRIGKAINFIEQNFDTTADFFDDYYEHGSKVPDLIATLVGKWPGFTTRVIADSKGYKHAARILAYADTSELKQDKSNVSDLSAFISASIDDVLGEGVPFEPDRLDALGVVVEDFSRISRHSKVSEHVWKNGLYKITATNLDFVFTRFMAAGAQYNLSNQHFTCVLDANDAAMIRGINQDFENYLTVVLLEIETNTEEDASAILAALGHNEVETELLEQFWQRQSYQIEDLNEVPERFHCFALEHERIVPSWANCLVFLTCDVYETEVLTDYLSKEGVKAALLKEGIPSTDTEKTLHKFLLDNEAFDNDVYRSYVEKLPLKFSEFPEGLSLEKYRILIETRKISFSASSLDELSGDDDLQVRFIVNNISDYSSNWQDYDVNERVDIRLIRADIPDKDKRKLINTIPEPTISGDASVAALIAPVLDRTSFDPDNYDVTTLQAMILEAKEVSVKISLFTKCLAYFSEDEIRSILSQMVHPFSRLSEFGVHPKIPNNPTNLTFIKTLKELGFISSFGLISGEKKIQINTRRK